MGSENAETTICAIESLIPFATLVSLLLLFLFIYSASRWTKETKTSQFSETSDTRRPALKAFSPHALSLSLSLYPKKHLLHQSLRGDHPLSLFLVAMATPSKLSPRHRDPCCAKKDGILSKTHRISDSCSISIFNLVSSA